MNWINNTKNIISLIKQSYFRKYLVFALVDLFFILSYNSIVESKSIIKDTGIVNSDSLAKNLVGIDAAYYIWNIDNSSSWKDLYSFLPSAKMSGISVYVSLLPPSKAPLYSEPYKSDYIKWAEQIAFLSRRYSNLKGFSIQDLEENIRLEYFSQSYINDVESSAKSINPKLQFDYPLSSGSDLTAPAAPGNVTAVLKNVNTNLNLPRELTYKINNMWQGWMMASIANKQRASITANPNINSANPTPSVGRLRIYQKDDYTGVSNEYPRAEFSQRSLNFDYGSAYKIEWDDYFDSDFVCDTVIDNCNHVYLAQVKASGVSSPSLVLQMNGNKYSFSQNVKLSEGNFYDKKDFGNIDEDKGKWQHWELKFLVDSTSKAWAVLRHNGIIIDSNKARVFPRTTNPDMHFNTGLYRLDWNTYPTKADSIVRYIDNINIYKISPSYQLLSKTTFGELNGNTTDSIAHYISLQWTNPSDADLDSVYIYCSTVNDPDSAKKIAAVGKNVTWYRDPVDKPGTRYYWLRAKDTSGNLSVFSSLGSDNSTQYIVYP